MIAPRTALVILAGGALFAVLGWALLPSLVPVVAPPAASQRFGDALWSDRALDVVVQAFLLLTGVLAVLLVLHDSRREGRDA